MKDSNRPKFNGKKRPLDLAGSLPPALTREEAEALLLRWQCGDQNARKPLIEGHLRLTADHAGRAADEYYNIRPRPEDLFSAGCVGLAQGVDGLLGLPHVNVLGYLGTWIDGAILDEIFPDRRSANRPEQPQQWPEDYDVAAPNLMGTIDAWEDLEACCETAADLRLLHLHRDGYTFPEIGKQLGIGKSTAHDRFQAIKRRFLERHGLPAEPHAEADAA